MVGRFLPALLIALTVQLFVGCDAQKQQNSFEDDASAPPSGFTATDAGGTILDEDPDDWRTAPLFLGKVRVDPVYPNPGGAGFVTVPVSVVEFNAVQGGRLVLRARSASGTLMLLDEILDAGSPGGFIFRFTPAVLARTGLVRLFVFDLSGELVSYGDLQIIG